MIFKTFDSDKDTFSSKFGIFGKSFEDIGNRFKKVSNELIATNDYTISNIANAWKNSSVKKDLSDKFIITKSDIRNKLKDLSVYDQDPSNILASLLNNKEKIEAGQKTWQDYFNTLKEGEKWQTKFIQENDLTKVSLDDVKNAQNAAKQSAIDYNNGLKQMTIGAKAANFALGALKNVLNVAVSYLVSWGISKLIQTITDHIHRAEKAVKKMGEAIQKVNSVQKEYSSNAKSLSEIEDRFVELSKGVNSFSENMKLSENEYQEYLNLSAKLADLFPDMIYGYDSQGEALLKIGDNAIETKEKLEELRKEQEKQKNQEIIDNGNDIAEGLYYDNKSRREEIEKKEVIIQASEGFTNFDNIIRPNNTHGNFAFNTPEQYNKYGKALEKIFDDLNLKYSVSSFGNGTLISLKQISKEQFEQIKKMYNDFFEIERNQTTTKIKGAKKNVAELKKEVGEEWDYWRLLFCDIANFDYNTVFNQMTPQQVLKANIALDIVNEQIKKANKVK